MDPAWLVIPGVILWTGILVLPWQPWRNRETLEANNNTGADLSDVTVLIPARNEADVIAETLLSLTPRATTCVSSWSTTNPPIRPRLWQAA